MGFESTYQWEDPIYTGVVFGTVMATLISICYYSLISVMAYTSLFILMVVAGLKLYTYVMVTFLKKETANPIAKYTGNNLYTITQDLFSGNTLRSDGFTKHLVYRFRNGCHHCTRKS